MNEIYDPNATTNVFAEKFYVFLFDFFFFFSHTFFSLFEHLQGFSQLSQVKKIFMSAFRFYLFILIFVCHFVTDVFILCALLKVELIIA